MKALSLHQPWASLIADRRKTVETRSWRPPARLLGQRIAIHAAKTIDRDAATLWYGADAVLPVGAILCTAMLADVGRVITRVDTQPFDVVRVYWLRPVRSVLWAVDEYGDFSPGRYLWRLDDIEVFQPPAPACGRQRLWNW